MENKQELEIKDKERLLELFKSILSLFDVNHNLGNNYLTGELNLSNFERKVILVGKILDKGDNFNLEKKLKDLKYSHGLKENFYYNPLLNIFKEIHQNPLIESESLLNLFFQKLEAYIGTLRNIPLSEYTFIFPINLNFKDGVPIQFIHIYNDVDIKLIPYSEFSNYEKILWDYIKKEYGDMREVKPSFAEEETFLINKCNVRDNFFFIAKVYARNIWFGVKKVVEEVEINAGLYNLALYYRRSVWKMGGDPFEKSIGNVMMPVVYIFKNNQIENILFSSYKVPKSTESIDLNKLNFIVKFISDIQQFKNEKLKYLISKAFGHYFTALNTSEYSISFLIFWNIIELLILKNNGVSLTEVIRRLKSIYIDSEANNKDLLERIDILFEKRNIFVHTTIDKITEYDRDFIKGIVEDLIIFFIEFGIKFDDIEQLIFLYQNLRKPLRILEKELPVIELIKKILSKSSISNNNQE